MSDVSFAVLLLPCDSESFQAMVWWSSSCCWLSFQFLVGDYTLIFLWYDWIYIYIHTYYFEKPHVLNVRNLYYKLLSKKSSSCAQVEKIRLPYLNDMRSYVATQVDRRNIRNSKRDTYNIQKTWDISRLECTFNILSLYFWLVPNI